MLNSMITIDDLLKAKEGEQYQFKEAKNRFDSGEAARCCCALANCGGGKLVFGITDKRPRKVVGSKAFDQPERTRKGLIDKLKVMVDFQLLYDQSGNRVLVFDVSSRPLGLPVQVDGVAWWYEGDSLIPMPEEIRRSIYDEIGFDFSGSICASAVYSDLDENAIEDFRDRWIEKSGNKRLANLSKKQLLHDCEAMTDDGITYAALILFGKRESLGRLLPQAEIVFEYRSSNVSGAANQREEFRMGFFACYNRLWELINLRNDIQHYQDGFFVYDIPAFNESVVREAILNAVSHRNYQMAGSVFIRQYQEKLIVESPGGLPHGISLDNILDRQVPRNRRIAEILALCGLVERSGQGMNIIYETSIKEAKQLPDFSGTDDNLCEVLMEYILNCGNFGAKREYNEFRSEKLISYMRTPRATFALLQKYGLYNWKATKKYPVLRPFAWIYQAVKYIKIIVSRKTTLKQLKSEISIAKERNYLFDALEVTQTSKGLVIYKEGEYVKEWDIK